ncbi:MAG: tRNA 2-selenouridine(34) synthase MnmH [Bacteroidia bacterium]|nr:tRNA 2-selenouridine(34) synthase MnmH [Bacteroidia bacterium]
MIREASPEELLQLGKDTAIIDVRTPAEFQHGHIPGAINLPLFNDDERKLVGTIYHQAGKEQAISKGLELAGFKLSAYLDNLKSLTSLDKLLVYCWRGGMRSESLAWLFSISGYDVSRLAGGYKAFRHFISDFFDNQFRFIVVGGKTGSGKTAVLKELEKRGCQVLDLEAIACHKGSVFGHIGQPPQPSNEEFENLIFDCLSRFNLSQPVWIEDESRTIGSNLIPRSVFNRMMSSPLLLIEVDMISRIDNLVRDYSECDRSALCLAIEKLAKRLGTLNTALAVKSVNEGDLANVVSLVLNHYDKTYDYSLKNHDQTMIRKIRLTGGNDSDHAVILRDIAEKNLNFQE